MSSETQTTPSAGSSTTSPARITLNVGQNLFEITGSDIFVAAQSEAYRETIIELLKKLNASPVSDQPEDDVSGPPAAPTPDQKAQPNGQKIFSKVLHIENDKVSILKSVPGTTVSKKAVGTALLYLWAKRSVGASEVPFSDIRELCRTHGCLDSANFSSHMKSAREWIVVDGLKGSSAQTCKLTVPGIEKAEELLKQLNGDESTQNP